MTHICVSKQTSIGTDNDMWPDRRQAFIWTIIWKMPDILSRPHCASLDHYGHEGACEQKDWRYFLHKAKCIVTMNPNRIVLIMIITWHFQFHFVNVSIVNLQYEYGAQNGSVLFLLLRHVVPHNDGNYGLIMSVAKARCTRDGLPHTFNFDGFNSVKIATTITHIYNESLNIMEGYCIAFNFPKTVLIINIVSVVTRGRLPYDGHM